MSTDLMATFTTAAGAPLPKTKLDSVDLIPYISQQDETAPHEFLFWRVGQKRAIRVGDWKALLEPGRFGSTDWQLYNLQEDLEEKNDLAKTKPSVLESLQQQWTSVNAEMIDPIFDPRKK